jgi:hypothetical protein
MAMEVLRQADRIGKWQHADLAPDLSQCIQFIQSRQQMLGHQHARPFVRMERSLNVGFRPGLR